MASSGAFLACFALFSVLFAWSDAAEYLVGGEENAWKSPGVPLGDWAKNQTFKIGDSLIFKYDNKIHSVLELSKEDFENCTTSKPIKKFTDGLTKYQLDRAGQFHFTGGSKEHCSNGQKLSVEVKPQNVAPAPGPSKAAGLRVGFIGCAAVAVATAALFGSVLA